jgi:hypothetical protein
VKRGGLRVGLLVALGALLGLLVWMTHGEATEAAPRQPATAPDAGELARLSADTVEEAPLAADTATQPDSLRPGATRAPQDPPARIAGRVLRRGDDAPLDGVEITVIADDARLREPAIVAVVTTANGYFDLPPDVVARRPHTLQFRWYGSGPRQPSAPTAPLGPGFELTARAGRNSAVALALGELRLPLDALEVWLDTGWIVRGRVVDSEGHPVRFVRVVASGERRDLFDFGPQTDEHGRFLLGDLDPAQPLVLSLEHFSEPVEGSLREIGPARSGEVKDLGDLALPYRVPGAAR